MVINSGASILRNSYYSYEAAIPATDTTPAVFEWVAVKDLGIFSFLTTTVLDIISYVALATTLGLIVLLVVKMRKYIDKNHAVEEGRRSG